MTGSVGLWFLVGWVASGGPAGGPGAPPEEAAEVLGAPMRFVPTVEETRVEVPAGTQLREQPAGTARVLRHIDAVMELPVLDRRGGWVRVDYDGLTGWVQLAGEEGALEPEGDAPGSPAEPAPSPAPDLDLDGFGTHRLGPWTVSTDVGDAELLASLDRLATEVDRAFRDRYGVAPGPVGHARPDRVSDEGGILAVDDTLVLSELDHGASIEAGRIVLPRAGRSDRALAAALLHELAHLLARRTFGTRLPPCLEEALGDDLAFALAQSRTEVDRHRLTVHSGGYWQAVERLIDALNRGRLPSLVHLSGLDWRAMGAPEGWELRYAQCALFVTFLLDGERGRWRDGLRSYLGEVADGREGDPDRLLDALDTDWKVLDAAFRRWLRGRDELTREEIRIE